MSAPLLGGCTVSVPLHACCQYYGQDGHYLGGDDCRFSPLLDGLKKEESAGEIKVDEDKGELLWSLIVRAVDGRGRLMPL